MRLFGVFSVLVLYLFLNFAPAAHLQADPLPNSGTYFIVSADSKEALQPVGSTVGQNVFLYEFNKSGVQKWTVTRKIDPKTKKPLNRYTIRLAGENNDLYLQPFPSPDHTCMISSGASVCSLAPGGGSFQIKSATLNGAALYTYPSPPGNTEPHFGPADSAQKCKWDLCLLINATIALYMAKLCCKLLTLHPSFRLSPVAARARVWDHSYRIYFIFLTGVTYARLDLSPRWLKNLYQGARVSCARGNNCSQYN
jgi:hypothetical protein